MNIPADDRRLLNDYVATKSHDAFGALVARHIGLVYAAALRRVGNADLAEDVTQAVFMILAAKAATIRREMPLPAWLYKVTRCTSANATKMENRRRHHEQQAAAQRPATADDTHATTEQSQTLLPILDAAIDRLGEKDRTAVLLRFFEGLSFEQMAATFGSSAHAAEVRASRAVEKLRRFFAAKGVAVPSGAVTATLAARTSDAAPTAAGPVAVAALGNSAGQHATALAAAASKSLASFTAANVWGAAAVLLLLLAAGGTALFTQLNGGSNTPIQARPASPPVPASTASPATRPLPANLDVAALVRKVRQDESWIDHVTSFHATFDDKWLITPQGVELRRAQLEKQFPLMDVNETSFPELKPQTDGTLVLAFDQRRLFYLRRSNGNELENFRIWDGQRAVAHEEYFSGQEGYAFDKEPQKFFGQVFLSDLPWLRTDIHHFWWWAPRARVSKSPEEEAFTYAQEFGAPEEYRLASREDFRGHDCYVLEAHMPCLSLYIGAADQRLYGIVRHDLPRKPEVQHKAESVEFQLAAEMGHPEVSNSRQLSQWERSLSQAQGAEEFRKLRERTWPLFVPGTTFWFENYKELSPGHWMPMFMGYDISNDDSPTFIVSSHQLTAVSVTVDKPLADEMFTMPMTEGVQVTDWTHDPPLIYKFKKNMTAAEWDTILADARQRKQDELARSNAQDRVLGKPAPDFGPGQWLNSKPLAWSDLRGKVVILDFFAEWCGPCQNDLPRTVEIHKNRQDTNVWVIGIHPPGSEIGKIQKFMQAFGITYPVYIDQTPPKDAQSWGLLYSQFGVGAIPAAVLIDSDGKVVAHGTLADMNARANQLAAAATQAK